MNINDYIEDVNGKRYVNDTLNNEMLLINNFKSVSLLPLSGEDKTLYIVNEKVFYYKSGHNVKQIVPLKKENKVEFAEEEKVKIKGKKFLRKENSDE